MSSENNNVVTTPKSQYAITAGCSTFIIWLADFFFTPEQTAKIIGIAPIFGSIIAYLISLAFAQWGFTPEELSIQRKLKVDKKNLEKQLDEAKNYPHRYEESYINQLKQELQETNLELTRIGRKSLEKNHSDSGS